MHTTVLKIDAMDGEACADKVARILNDTDGVSEVSVSLRDGMAIMRVDETLTSPHLLTRALALAGYPSYPNGGAPEPKANAGGCCGGCCGG
ncbi:heavy-metal-associated domain-containing protein [Oxalobacteraceae bacterium OTU3REALA1]|nr:heavy-metal-associated domain-containing protein [Oxalobacteraceae bacterium OTU3REALA1]